MDSSATQDQQQQPLDASRTTRLSASVTSQSTQPSQPSPSHTLSSSARTTQKQPRRIIAEDPEWNLAPVDKLSQLALSAIVANFEKKPILNDIPQQYTDKVFSSISVDIPLEITAKLIDDEGYWERRSKAHFKICDVSKHGNNFKRLYFERKIQKELEEFVPTQELDSEQVLKLVVLLKLASPFVQELTLRQMRQVVPPLDAPLKETDPQPNHLPMELVFEHLKNLKSLNVYFGLRDVGMNYSKRFFGMTMPDCISLANALKSPNTLETLTIQASLIDDDRARILADALITSKTIKTVNVSHNRIGDAGARGFAKVIATSGVPLEKLDLSNNKIGRAGALSIAKSLEENTCLKNVSLSMNVIGDAGGVLILQSIAKNKTLTHLDLSGNGLGKETVSALTTFLKSHQENLTSLNVSCNRLGTYMRDRDLMAIAAAASAAAAAANNANGGTSTNQPPVLSTNAPVPQDTVGKLLFDAVSTNKYITSLDLRATDISNEYLTSIQGIVNENASDY